MANVKISQLTELLNADIDPQCSIPIVDVLTSTTKRVTIGELDLRYASSKLTPDAGVSPILPFSIGPTVNIPASSLPRRIVFLNSTGGNVSITGLQAEDGVLIGDELILVGTSDINYPTFRDDDGLALNGSIDLKLNRTIYLVWSGAVWLEISRK